MSGAAGLGRRNGEGCDDFRVVEDCAAGEWCCCDARWRGEFRAGLSQVHLPWHTGCVVRLVETQFGGGCRSVLRGECLRGCILAGLFREAESGAEFECEEAVAEGFEELSVELLSVLEADFAFGGVDVDVDECGRHVEEQEADGVSADHQESAVGFFQRVLEAAILDPASVEEEELIAASGAAE